MRSYRGRKQGNYGSAAKKAWATRRAHAKPKLGSTKPVYIVYFIQGDKMVRGKESDLPQGEPCHLIHSTQEAIMEAEKKGLKMDW